MSICLYYERKCVLYDRETRFKANNNDRKNLHLDIDSCSKHTLRAKALLQEFYSIQICSVYIFIKHFFFH